MKFLSPTFKNAVVFDIEANGLREEADRVWTLCSKNLNRQSVEARIEEIDIRDKLHSMSKSDIVLIGHNILGYDLPVLKNVYDFEPHPTSKIIDTFLMSSVLNPDRGGHSLDWWADKANQYIQGEPNYCHATIGDFTFEKVPNEDWSQFSMTMLRRCKADVRLTQAIFEMLVREVRGSDLPMNTEHTFGAHCFSHTVSSSLIDLKKKLTGEQDDVKEFFDLFSVPLTTVQQW